jgi:ABC-type nickel/cobalt efflux system permease component RcnA
MLAWLEKTQTTIYHFGMTSSTIEIAFLNILVCVPWTGRKPALFMERASYTLLAFLGCFTSFNTTLVSFNLLLALNVVKTTHLGLQPANNSKR